jgi:hypothetical protein
MPPILILGYVAGTYGNYVSQQLHTLSPHKFRLKHIHTDVEYNITDTGEKFYHNSEPWLGNSFYIDACPFQNPTVWNIQQARAILSQDPDWNNLNTDSLNIVFTHWYKDADLLHLQQILNCRVAKIVYQEPSCQRIAERFVKIISYINDYQRPYKFDLYLDWVKQHANDPTEFPVIEYERIFEPEYLKKWAEAFK